jgi:hypothetical protein
VRYWKIIADHLSEAGFVDAHRSDGKRFIVRADEELTVFLDSNRRFEPSIHKIKRIVGPILSVILLKPNLNLIAVWIDHICEWKARILLTDEPTARAGFAESTKQMVGSRSPLLFRFIA